MPIYTQLEDEWCWNAVAQMASAMKIYTNYTKSTGYSYTTSLNFIVGKLMSSNNPIALGMEFSDGAQHALAVRAYDDRNYNQRVFYVDPGLGQATSKFFSWYELQSMGYNVFGVSYYLEGAW